MASSTCAREDSELRHDFSGGRIGHGKVVSVAAWPPSMVIENSDIADPFTA